MKTNKPLFPGIDGKHVLKNATVTISILTSEVVIEIPAGKFIQIGSDANAFVDRVNDRCHAGFSPNGAIEEVLQETPTEPA